MMPTLKVVVVTAAVDWMLVKAAVDKAKAHVLVRIGQYVRKVAKNLIKSRKRPSRPGESPTNQTGLLKDFLLYEFDPIEESVVIGPKRLVVRSTLVPGKTGPQVLEFGSHLFVPVIHQSRTGRWMRISRQGAIRARERGATVSHRRTYMMARPYMAPALERSRPYLPKAWANSVKSG